MPVRLTIRPPRTNQPRVVEFDDAHVTIGRSSRCDIRLPFRSVSGHHLTILQSANRLEVRDEHSTNGTLLDGEPLEAGADSQIKWGATLEIVDLSIAVERIPDLDAGISLDQTGTLARQMLGEALLSPSAMGAAGTGSAADEDLESAYFEVLEGPTTGQRLRVPDDLERGRIADDKDALISLAGLDAALEIYRDGDGFGLAVAQDTVAKRPVMLNDTALLEARRLSSGDRIATGAVSLRFVDPLESYLDELDGAIAPSSSPSQDPPLTAEPEQTVPVGRAPGADASAPTNETSDATRNDPGSERRSLSVIEVGVIAVSFVVLIGVVFLLLSVLGLL